MVRDRLDREKQLPVEEWRDQFAPSFRTEIDRIVGEVGN